jgi:hypothetical protein
LEPGCEVETARDGYLYARLDGVGLRLFYYPYPQSILSRSCTASRWPQPRPRPDEAGSHHQPGTRRDFVDLYLLCRKLPLTDLFDLAEDKFGHVRDFPLQAFKGLADTTLVAGEPMPRLALPLDWSEVAGWLQGEVAELARERLGV